MFKYFIPFVFSEEEKNVKNKKFKEPVSIIICAKNEEANLLKNLPFILSQNYEDFEIVVVNDRSIDGTQSVLNEFKKSNSEKINVIHLTKVPKGFNSKKYAITKGVEVAKNEILIFTDADCKPLSQSWLVEMLNKFDDSKSLVLGYSPLNAKEGFLGKIIQFETLLVAFQYLSMAFVGKPFMGVGRNLAYRKSAFNKVNGFENIENVVGGDDDLIVQKIGTNKNTAISFSLNSQTISDAPDSFKSWISQKRRHLNSGVKYDFNSKFKIGLFQQSFVFYYLFAVVMLFIPKLFPILGMLYGLRMVMFWVLLYNFSKKVNSKLSLVLFPVLEFCYFMIFSFVGISVLVRDKKEWV